jgi:hypothetical protein
MADSDNEINEPLPSRRQRRGAAPVEAPVENEPAQPRRQRRGVVVEPEAEQEAEQEEASGAPVRRSARKPAAKSAAAKRKNLREARRVLAEQGFNAENAREGGEEAEGNGVEGAEDEGGEGEGVEAEAGAEGPLGVLGAMIKSTVNYLKTDPYQNAFSSDTNEEPYPSLKELYETVKENPESAETLRQVTSDFRTLKQSYHDAGCDTDINVAMNPKCLGIQAGLYMRLFDIRKSINESLEQMKPIQQQAILARINREARPEYNGGDNVFVPAGV